MITLTEKQNTVLEWLYDNGLSGPTEIGLALGQSYNSASAYVNAPLKKLVSLGFAERRHGGVYRLTNIGRDFYESGQ